MNDLVAHGAAALLMYLVLPIWILAGFVDYWCHRASHIEDSSGTPESALHLLQFGTIAVPVLLALFMEINALFFLIAALAIVIHHGVAFVDVRYANRTRTVTPLEQMVHSFLEIMPITAFLLLAALHWPQLLDFSEPRRHGSGFMLRLKPHPLQPWYVLAAIGTALMFNLLPYLEECLRCRRAARHRAISNMPH